MKNKPTKTLITILLAALLGFALALLVAWLLSRIGAEEKRPESGVVVALNG